MLEFVQAECNRLRMCLNKAKRNVCHTVAKVISNSWSGAAVVMSLCHFGRKLYFITSKVRYRVIFRSLFYRRVHYFLLPSTRLIN